MGARFCAYGATIHGNSAAQDELAGKLNALLDERARLVKSGDTEAVLWGRAIGNADVNYLISECLDRVVEGDGPLTPEMAALDQRMRGATDSVVEAAEIVQGNGKIERLIDCRNRSRVRAIAWTILAAASKPTFRAIARELQVAPSTVIRWFTKEERAEMEKYWHWRYNLLKSPPKLRRS